MKKRVTSGSVTVTGPPTRICSVNSGSMEPRLPITLPNLTETNLRPVWPAIQAASFSATRLEWPSAVVGLAALSVEIFTKWETPLRSAARSTLRVPRTFVFQASTGYCCSNGACLRAAAWNTTSGRRSWKISWRAAPSRMLARTVSRPARSPRPVMEIWVCCSPVSSWSSMMSSAGENWTICRHSSEPMEPPAPVTRTRLPLM